MVSQIWSHPNTRFLVTVKPETQGSKRLPVIINGIRGRTWYSTHVCDLISTSLFALTIYF